eukprot:5678875-Pleurochrysis_carterae.AAC.1
MRQVRVGRRHRWGGQPGRCRAVWRGRGVVRREYESGYRVTGRWLMVGVRTPSVWRRAVRWRRGGRRRRGRRRD